MEIQNIKHVSDSLKEQIQILMPEHINGYNRLFGGKLVEWLKSGRRKQVRKALRSFSRPLAI